MDEQALQKARQEELTKRIAEVSGYPDETFGVLRGPELAVVAVVTVVLPLAIVLLTR